MKDIIGYEGLYAVASCGQVWSYRSKKFLSPSRDKDGYLQVLLYKDGEKQAKKIHRLVAEAYIENPENKPVVHHKDEAKNHNWLNNLEWATVKENNLYSDVPNKAAKAHKKPVYCVELEKEFESAQDAAALLGLYRQNICACCNGRAITTGGYHWRYANE